MRSIHLFPLVFVTVFSSACGSWTNTSTKIESTWVSEDAFARVTEEVLSANVGSFEGKDYAGNKCSVNIVKIAGAKPSFQIKYNYLSAFEVAGMGIEEIDGSSFDGNTELNFLLRIKGFPWINETKHYFMFDNNLNINRFLVVRNDSDLVDCQRQNN